MTKLVSYKFSVEEEAWQRFNIIQFREWEKRNNELLSIIKKIEKRYNIKPNKTDYEQFFYMVSKIEWE